MEPRPSSSENIQQAYRVAYLVAGYLQQTLTEQEQAELDAWIHANEHNKNLFAELTDPEKLKVQAAGFPADQTERYLAQAKVQIRVKEKSKVRRLWMVGAAAAVAAVLVVWVVLRPADLSVATPEDMPIALTQPAPTWANWRHATLNLGDGRAIALGMNKNDTILDKGILVKGGSTLVYGPAVPNRQHTVAVPEYATYTVQLPDGTVATLNAYSELSYPTQFTGNERKVFLIGEGYFAVAKDTARPFRVETKIYPSSTMTIEAVGTAFNVDAHPEDPTALTTLVEGKVRVQLDQQTPILLHPNEAVFLSKGSLQKITVDASAATAWTQHRFEFNDTPLIDVLRQLAYWYDIDFESSATLPAIHLNGTFSRDLPIDQVLTLVSQTGEFKYQRRGQHITLTF